MSGMLFKSHAMYICNVHNSKFKQAGWVIHLLDQFYSPVATFPLYSGFFRWYIVEEWLSTTVGLRNSGRSFYVVSFGNNL